MRKLLPLLLLFYLAMSSGCRLGGLEDLEQVRYDAEYALPLVDTRVSIRQLLENVEEATTILIDQDGQIRFTYQGEVITQTSEDLFATIDEVLPPVIPVLSPRMALPFTTPEGIRVDRADLKAGELIYVFENRNAASVDVVVTFPQLNKNGQPMSFRHSLPGYGGTGTVPRATNLLSPAALKDYQLTTENDSVYIIYQALDPEGNELELANFFLRVQNLDFAYAEGYLGDQVHEGTRDTIEIDFFDNWTQGEVYFEEPKITFLVENSFGVPTRSVVNLFNVITVRGEVLPVEGDFINEGIDFPFPAMNEVGQVKRGSFVFTKENSNIDRLLSAGPTAVDYDVDARTNPDGDTSIRGFLTDSSYYRVQVEVELPLFGRASDFVASDTFDLDFTSYEDVDNAEFKVVADNRLPLNVDIQGYFLDVDGVVLDSLLDARERVVAAASVDQAGIASGTVQKITYAPFEGERFDRIRGATRLLLSASFSTVQGGEVSVRPLAEQDARIRIGVKLGVSRQ